MFDLKSSVLQTTSHAITQAVNKQTYDALAKIGIEEGWLYADQNQMQLLNELLMHQSW